MLFESIACISIRALSLALRFIFTIMMVRIATPEDWGIFSYLTSIVTIYVFLSGVEFHTYAVREVAFGTNLHSKRTMFSNHIKFSVVIGLFGLGITLCFLSRGRFHDAYNSLIICILLLLELLLTEFSRYLRIFKMNIQSNVIVFVQSSLWFPIAWALIYFKMSKDQPHNIMMLCWMIGDICSLVLSLYWLKGYSTELLNRNHLLDIKWILTGFACSWKYYGIAIVNLIRGQSDRLLITFSMGLAALGKYAFYQYFSSIIDAFIQTGIIAIYTPRVLEAVGELDSVKEIKLIREMLFKSALTSIFLAGIIISFMPLVQTIIKNENYKSNQTLLPWLLFGQVLSTIATCFHVHMYARRLDNHILIIDIIAAVVALSLNLILIPRVGLMGAVQSTVLVWSGVLLLKGFYSLKIQRELLQHGNPLE